MHPAAATQLFAFDRFLPTKLPTRRAVVAFTFSFASPHSFSRRHSLTKRIGSPLHKLTADLSRRGFEAGSGKKLTIRFIDRSAPQNDAAGIFSGGCTSPRWGFHGYEFSIRPVGKGRGRQTLGTAKNEPGNTRHFLDRRSPRKTDRATQAVQRLL